MDQDEGWFVASILNRLFRKRPGCALSTFLAIAVLVLGWMLLSAKQQADLAFPIFGLAFIVLMVVIRAAGVLLRRWRGEPEQPEESVPDEEDAALATEASTIPPASEVVHAEDQPRTSKQSPAGQPDFFMRAAPALLGILGGAATVCPSLYLVGLTLPIPSQDDEGMAYAVGLVACALTPLGAVLGAIAGWAAAAIRRARNPGDPVGLSALLAGAGAGLLVTALASAAYARMCGWSVSCPR